MASPSMPRPKSPPELYGKRREFAKVVMLEREIGFLKEELKSVETLQPASFCIKEVADYMVTNPEPLITLCRKTRNSCRFWKWLCGNSCFKNMSWICCGCCSCCCSDCSIEMPNCGCANCCFLPDCCSCTLPKCSSCGFKPRCPSCLKACLCFPKCNSSCCPKWPDFGSCCPKCPKCPDFGCCCPKCPKCPDFGCCCKCGFSCWPTKCCSCSCPKLPKCSTSACCCSLNCCYSCCQCC